MSSTLPWKSCRRQDLTGRCHRQPGENTAPVSLNTFMSQAAPLSRATTTSMVGFENVGQRVQAATIPSGWRTRPSTRRQPYWVRGRAVVVDRLVGRAPGAVGADVEADRVVALAKVGDRDRARCRRTRREACRACSGKPLRITSTSAVHDPPTGRKREKTKPGVGPCRRPPPAPVGLIATSLIPACSRSGRARPNSRRPGAPRP